MTPARHAILVIYLLTVAALCVWVPWRAPIPESRANIMLGYGPVFSGPHVPKHWQEYSTLKKSEFMVGRDVARVIPEPPGYAKWRYFAFAQIDTTRLGVELVFVSAIFALVFFAVPAPKHAGSV